MSSEKTNELFWLYYGQAIIEKAGANFGPSGAFFLATEAQKGPLAGDSIPPEYTNQGLYDVGNNLLAIDNLFYNPSALHGYVDALNTYLLFVDLGGQPSAALDAALLDATKQEIAIQANYTTQLRKAKKQYDEAKEMGLIPADMTFSDYVMTGNAPGFSAATTELASIGATIQSIQSQINGPLAAQIGNDKAAINQGLDLLFDHPGFNFHAASGNVLSDAELLQKLQLGETVPDPPFMRRPAYHAPSYRLAVQAAMKKARGDYEPENSVEFMIDMNRNTSDFNFGQTSAGGSVGFSYGGWFSFNASANHSSESSTLQTGSESESVRVRITYDTIQAITINPGAWNVDVSKYRLRASAPKETKTLARVSQLIIATGLGYQITVGSSTARDIDTKMQETTSGGGSISVFGLPVNVGASGSRSTEHNTHDAFWDNASQTFTVVPAQDVGFATVVGLVGEKFDLM